MDQKLKQTLIDYGKQVVVPLINENAEDAKFTKGESGITSATITDAIKETYSKAVAAQTTADNATAAAKAAHDAANAAGTKAQNAYNAANNAANDAANAQNTANTAVTNAATAQATADDAFSAANAAQTDATDALANASNAQNTADSAYSAANAANTAAANAQSKADSAFNAATVAQATADAATEAAATAQAAAESAASAAANAHNAANAAHSTANTANETANQAVSAAATAQSTADSAVSAASAAASAAANAHNAANTIAVTQSGAKIQFTNAAGTITDVTEFTMTETTGTGDVLKSYTLKMGLTPIGTVNIPKDFLVKSASVKTCTVADEPVKGYKVGDKYIDFVINAKEGTGTESHVYLLVNELVDAYIAGAGITISASNEIALDAANVAMESNGDLPSNGVAVYTHGKLANFYNSVVVTAADSLSSINVLTGTGLGNMLPSTTDDFTEIYNAINAANSAAN